MRKQLRALLFVAAAALALAFAGAASAGTYVVLYKAEAVSSHAGTKIRAAGGTVVASYPQIGVIIARSGKAGFRAALMKDSRVAGVSATARFRVQLPDAQADAGGPPPGNLPNSPATDADSFSADQWDMQQIHAPEAHEITGGSPDVVVGDIDTGLDYRHPDLTENVSDADSANCLSGAPVQGMVAADDDNGHGTHTAGTIAAASNGIGVVGVAPNVKIAGIKSGNADGYFFPEAVICGFMWAGDRHLDVTNNSYFADPYLFNCRNDPVQRAIWKAESRAIKYAESQGVTVVAAEGNESDDLAHPTQDVTSPDDSTPVTRTVHNNCVVIPNEVSGVISVTATGVLRQKSFYSSYGVGVTDVAAPGGDSILQPTADAGHGRVLSTYPAALPCTRQRDEPTGDPTYPTAVYCWLQGTSMASPHVAGLAALIISRYGSSSNLQNGHMRPGAVESLIQNTADPTPCPDDATLALYEPFVSTSNGAPQTCSGGTGYNGWYGNGVVNALTAVSR